MTPLQAERLAVVCEMLTLAGAANLSAMLRSAVENSGPWRTSLSLCKGWAHGEPMPEEQRRAILDALGLLWATLGGAT